MLSLSSIPADRRATFVHASGEGDVLAAFLSADSASHTAAAAAAAAEVESATAEPQTMQLPPVCSPARVLSSSRSASPAHTAATTVPAAPAASAPSSSRSARPPLHTARSAKHAAAAATNATSVRGTSRDKENRASGSFASTAQSPLLSHKRKSLANSNAPNANSTAAMGKPPVHSAAASASGVPIKKARTSIAAGPSSSAHSRTLGQAALTAGLPSPRRSVDASKRRSVQPQSLAASSLGSFVDDSVPVAAAAAAGVHAEQSQRIREWRSTAAWRLVLLRVQKQAITASATQLAELTQVHADIQQQLRAAETENTALLASRSQLQTQLSASSHSESMLKLAAEELGGQIETLQGELASSRRQYERELANVKAQLADRTQQYEAAQSHASQTSVSFAATEADLRAQLSRAESALAEVREARLTDELHRKSLHRTIQDLKGSIRVFCRIRPLSTDATAMQDDMDAAAVPTFTKTIGNAAAGSSQAAATNNFTQQLHVCAPAGVRVDGAAAKQVQTSFTFDKVFTAESTQAELFAELDELITSAMDGSANVSVFAYGATGSGKTHTMLSPPATSQASSLASLDTSDSQAGMIPRAIGRLFAYASAAAARHWLYSFKVSLCEIYNDEIVPLISQGGKANAAAKECKITHDKQGRVQVAGLDRIAVASASEVLSLLHTGSRARSVASTGCNARSSRSHTVFQLHCEGSNSRSGEKIASTINLVDRPHTHAHAHACAQGCLAHRLRASCILTCLPVCCCVLSVCVVECVQLLVANVWMRLAAARIPLSSLKQSTSTRLSVRW